MKTYLVQSELLTTLCVLLRLHSQNWQQQAHLYDAQRQPTDAVVGSCCSILLMLSAPKCHGATFVRFIQAGHGHCSVGLTNAAVADQVNDLLGHPHMAWRGLSHKLGNCCCMQALESECMSMPARACSAMPDKALLLGRLSCCSEAMGSL